MSDIEVIKRLILPIANRSGVLRGYILSMITPNNMHRIYSEIGEQGIRDAAEAIIRVGRTQPPTKRKERKT